MIKSLARLPWYRVFLTGLCCFVWGVCPVAADITSNRVLYLRLNEGTGGGGTPLTDSGTGGHTASLDSTNPPSWLSGASCKQGACLSFDGVNDRAFVNDATDLSPTNGAGQDTAYTITAWVYLNDITDGEGIIAARVTGGIFEYFFWIAGSTLYMQFNNVDASLVIGRSAPLTTGAHQAQWMHVAATYSGSETNAGINLYINGIDVDDADAASGAYIGLTHTAMPLELGIYDTTAGALSFRLDEFKIFTRALTPSEVVDDFNALTAVPRRRRVVIY